MSYSVGGSPDFPKYMSSYNNIDMVYIEVMIFNFHHFNITWPSTNTPLNADLSNIYILFELVNQV